MSVLIEAGNIYLVKDDSVNLPPEVKRTQVHQQRTVIVLSTNKINHDDAWEVVMVAPISSSTKFRTEYCVQLNVPEGNVTKKCWIRTSAIQPIAKADLGDFTGKVSDAKLDDVMQELLSLLPLTVEDDEVMEWSDDQDSLVEIAPAATPLPSAVFGAKV
jgi:mRNA-degrading endonuclease toxin of MazEF toxin-antitoxin module